MNDHVIESHAPHDGGGRRVLIVTDSLANGGMERQLALLATSLPREWRAKVVALGDGPYRDILAAAGVDVTLVKRRFRWDPGPALPVARAIRAWRPDVVHAFGWMSMWAALAPCRLRGTPIVDASIQNAFPPTGLARLRFAVTSRADVVIANSRAGLVAYRVDSSRGVVVRNGFDPARWALCAGGPSGAARPTTVVMTARMHPHKDYRTFLDAARSLSRGEPGAWRFLAVGSGDGRAPLMEAYADLIASGAAAFPEAGTEVLDLVRGSSVGVLLTDPRYAAEGISNSIMEYMACGLPVVCTDVGGNPELVLDGETGLLVPAHDAGALSGALRRLRDDPALAGRMGLAGRERIATVFTVDALVAGTVAAYERAMGGL